MNSLHKIKIMYIYTFREILKSKILVNITFLGIGLVIVTWIASQFTHGVPSRVAIDFGLGTLTVSSVGIAIFMGVGLLSKEIDTRTVYMVISRPVPRYAFILGKVMGLIGILILNILILGILTLSVYAFMGGKFESLIIWSFGFTILEAIIILLVVIFFSLVTNNTLAVIFTIVIYIVGHAVNETYLTSMVKNNFLLKSILNGYEFVLPAFYKLNLKNEILYQQNLPLSYLLKTLMYSVSYIGFLLFLSISIFNKKNLD
jgi:ABC-type transport system involved in multi-copper enzyme maturation permease subunit